MPLLAASVISRPRWLIQKSNYIAKNGVINFLIITVAMESLQEFLLISFAVV